MDYTVIGDAVNLAQRLQATATPNQILVTNTTYQQIKSTFDGQYIGDISVKNKTAPVVVYEVMSL